jgi:hypothetical protein
MQTTIWNNCYPSSWKGTIVPEAMAHPAKYSSRLIRRIYEHILAEGWVKPGDRVLDPFGGVALGSPDAMRYGLCWTGIELEEKFHALGNQNIESWMRRFGSLPDWGSACLLKGDSRRLLELLDGSGVECSVSSPPYADSVNASDAANDTDARLDRKTRAGVDMSKAKNRGGPNSVLNQPQVYGQSQGKSNGQLAGMGTDGFEAAISSPPYDESDQNYQAGWKRFHKNHTPLFTHDIQREAEYGATEGQISVSSDFWLAARQIVDQVYIALRPGGHAVWVVKDYVKNKQIVPFSDQWRQLCEAAGFETLHEHHAMLVHHRGTQHTLEGGTVERKTESKSFFRRLAEKKGSPRIDYETVFCMVKPMESA